MSRTPRRIAQVVGSLSVIGGAERLAISLHQHASSFGWQSVILSPWKAALDIGRGAQFDVVHAHLLKAALAVALAPTTPALTILTHQYANYYSESGRPLMARLDAWSISKFDQVVAISEFCARHVRRFSSRCSTIRTGWDGHACSSQQRSIVCLSHLRPEKGVDVLLRAYARLPSPGRPSLLIAGTGPEAPNLKILAEQLRIDKEVHFLGYVMDPMMFLASGVMAVQPSRLEALGVSVLEAMGAGLPVIASRVGGLPELVEPGVTGELFTPGDYVELAEHIERLLADPDLRRRMGREAKRVARRYTMESTMRNYYELYEELLAGRRGAG